MHSVITQMLEKYSLNEKKEYINALKEIVQEIALSALARSDFFEHAAFYGGTALRIFYGLDRFSEDLDFSLIKKEEFDLSKYFKILDDTFKLYGFSFKAEKKVKTSESLIQSAFLKGNTLEHILLIENNNISTNIHKDEVIKIKFEIDTNPPAGATYEYKYGLLPSPYRVRLYDKESLFSGKLHAVLCRSWNQRFKGRDLYDYVFYLSSKSKPNLPHLKERLVESNKWNSSIELTIEDVKNMLYRRFKEIDFNNAKKDVIPFISDITKLDLWDVDFFTTITKSNL